MLQTNLRSGLGPTSADLSGWGCHILCVCKTLPTPGAVPGVRGEQGGFFLCLKAQRAKPEALKEVSCSPYSALAPLPGSESCAPPNPGIPSPTRMGTGRGRGIFAPLCSQREQENRERKLREGRGTAKVILLPAGVSTGSPVRQEPFSRAAAIYLFYT